MGKKTFKLVKDTMKLFKELDKLTSNSKGVFCKMGIVSEFKATCPHCGCRIPAEETDNLGDIGCPSCRFRFDVEDQWNVHIKT